MIYSPQKHKLSSLGPIPQFLIYRQPPTNNVLIASHPAISSSLWLIGCSCGLTIRTESPANVGNCVLHPQQHPPNNMTTECMINSLPIGFEWTNLCWYLDLLTGNPRFELDLNSQCCMERWIEVGNSLWESLFQTSCQFRAIDRLCMNKVCQFLVTVEEKLTNLFVPRLRIEIPFNWNEWQNPLHIFIHYWFPSHSSQRTMCQLLTNKSLATIQSNHSKQGCQDFLVPDRVSCSFLYPSRVHASKMYVVHGMRRMSKNNLQ